MSLHRQILADSPLAYWPLDETSGSFADASGNGRTLTPSNVSLAQTPPTGVFDKAPHWNGTNAYASAALNLSAQAAITLAWWMSWDSYAANDALFGEFTANYNNNSGGFLLDPNSGVYPGYFEYAVNNPNPKVDAYHFAQPSAGVWHHHVATIDMAQASATTFTAWVDGVAQTMIQGTAQNATGNFANSTLYVGSRGGTALFGAMYVRHLAVFSGVLSAARITAQRRAALRSGTVGP